MMSMNKNGGEETTTTTMTKLSSANNNNNITTTTTSKVAALKDDKLQMVKRLDDSEMNSTSMYIAHVTLRLNVNSSSSASSSSSTSSSHASNHQISLQNSGTFYPTWKYITIRRNPMTSSFYNYHYG